MNIPSLESLRWHVASELTTIMVGAGINPASLEVTVSIDAGKMRVRVVDRACAQGQLLARTFPADDLHAAFAPRIAEAFRRAIVTETNSARVAMGLDPFEVAA